MPFMSIIGKPSSYSEFMKLSCVMFSSDEVF